MTRLDNLPWEFDNEFSYIREDAECRGFTEQDETEEYVLNEFNKSFPSFTRRLQYGDIYVENYEHDLCDDEEVPTYAVYIYFNGNAVNVLKEMFPHVFL